MTTSSSTSTASAESSSHEKESFLEITHLIKQYGKEQILKDINLSIRQGEFLVLLGPSGCGKSTLLNCITGLIATSGGDIALRGKSITNTHPSKRNLAMVFQSYALYPNMTVAGNIRFGMEIRKLPPAEIDTKVKEVAETLQITDHLSKKPAELSGGQRQRVAIARALVRHPEIFLFDEPLSNLDAKLRMDMRTELKRLHSRLETTIIYVTHDQIEALTLATRIAIMEKGQIVQFTTPDNIYHRPVNTFVARFIGSPEMHIFPVRLSKKSDQYSLEIPLPASDHPARFPLPESVDPQNPLLTDILATKEPTVLLGLRSEWLSLAPPDHPKSANTIPAQVDVLEPIGSDTYIICSHDKQEFTVRAEAGISLAPGDKVNLIPDMKRALLFHPETEIRLG